MKHDVEQLLQQALSPTEEPSFWLNEKIMQSVKENEHMKKSIARIPIGVMAAILILMIGTVGVLAGWKYLKPEDVAKEFSNETLAKAFESEDAITINETQEYGGYKVTLLGIVSGKELSDYASWDDEGNIIDDMSYIVAAIENADGTPRPDTSDENYGNDCFYMSPYVKGIDMRELNVNWLQGGYSECVVDGVQYRVLELGNLEIFAKRGIYLGVSYGPFYNSQAYIMDQVTGEITRNEECKGLNALFKLPIPAFKGDETAVEAFLEEMKKEREYPVEEEAAEDEIVPMDRIQEVVLEVEGWILADYQANADCIYEEKLTIDENNAISYKYESEDGSGSEATQWMDYLFEAKKTGAFVTAVIYNAENEDVIAETFEMLEDGSVMLRVFVM